MKLKSEYFKDSYAIHIGRKAAKLYAEYIYNKGLDKKGVAVLNNTTDKTRSCIVVPIEQNFKVIEKDLFDYMDTNPNLKSGGFWGQYGVGYLGETWVVQTRD